MYRSHVTPGVGKMWIDIVWIDIVWIDIVWI